MLVLKNNLFRPSFHYLTYTKSLDTTVRYIRRNTVLAITSIKPNVQGNSAALPFREAAIQKPKERFTAKIQKNFL